MTVTIETRVARRFTADQIADPKQALANFQHIVRECCKNQSIARELLAFCPAWMKEEEALRAEDLRLTGSHSTVTPPFIKGAAREIQQITSFVRSPSWFGEAADFARVLFWAILQQYVLPPALQRPIEAASKFWDKKRINGVKPKGYDYVENTVEYCAAYLKITDALEKQLLNAEAAIAKGKLHSDPTVSVKSKIHVGSFDVVNTGGFDDETMKKAADIVSKAERALTSHGLGKTCYGDVLVSKSLTQKKSVAAFYILASDEMFIRADTPDNWDTVRVVCHELAHRLDHKFLSSKKSEIEKLYWTINNNAMDIKLPKRGETCLYEGKPMIVTDLDFRRMSVTIIEDAPPKCFACGQPVAGHQPDAEHKAPILRQRAYVMPAETFYQLQGKEVDPSKITFITNYAKENAAENFAEMVSFYVLGKLPPHLVALLEPILM